MEKAIQIMVDVSGSMKPTMRFAKWVLQNAIVPALDYNSKIGLLTFCTDEKGYQINHLAKPSLTTFNSLQRAAIDIQYIPNSRTPVSEALRQAVYNLLQFEGHQKRILLISDGVEDAETSYLFEINKLIQKGLNIQFNMVGINLANLETLKAQLATTSTNGQLVSLYSAHQYQYLAYNISSILQRLNSNGANAPGIAILPQLNQEISQSIERPDPNRLKQIGRVSEKYLFVFLKNVYQHRVIWINEIEEKNEDHDFEVLNDEGTSVELIIECKGTSGKDGVFFMTLPEWKLYLNNRSNYHLYFIKNCEATPELIHIPDLLQWMAEGKLVPCSNSPHLLDPDRILFTITI